MFKYVWEICKFKVLSVKVTLWNAVLSFLCEVGNVNGSYTVWMWSNESAIWSFLQITFIELRLAQFTDYLEGAPFPDDLDKDNKEKVQTLLQ